MEEPKMPQEQIGDKKPEFDEASTVEKRQQKKPAKIETPTHFVPTKKEAEEKKSWLKEKFDVWRHEK